MKYLLNIISVLIFLMAVVPLASAAIYVQSDGDDGNAGTSVGPSNALATLGQAATNAVSGDTIHIKSGTYEEIATIADASTWLGCTDGGIVGWEDSLTYPLIDGGVARASAFISNQTDVAISGFNIQSTTGYSIDINSADNYVDDCHIALCDGGISIDGARTVTSNCSITDVDEKSYYVDAADTVLEDSTITINLLVDRPLPIFLDPSSDGAIVRDCTIYTTARYGGYSVHKATIAYIYNSTNWTLEGNSFTSTYGNSAYRQISVRGVATGVSITDNSFTTINANRHIASDSTLTGEINRNSFTGSGTNDYGITFGGDGPTFDSNIFTNQLIAIYPYFRDKSCGPIRNNYIVAGTGLLWIANAATEDHIISNNIFVCDYPTFGCDSTAFVMRNNLSWTHDTDNLWGGASDFNNLSTVDPLIVNVTTGTIFSNSPCFGGGTDGVGWIAITDVDGLTFTGPDIGPHSVGVPTPFPVDSPPPTPYFPTPTRTPTTPTPIPTPTSALTPTPQPTPTSALTPSPVPTASPIPTASLIPTPIPTSSPIPTASPIPTITPADIRFRDLTASTTAYLWWVYAGGSQMWECPTPEATYYYFHDISDTGGWWMMKFDGYDTPFQRRATRTLLTFQYPPTPTPATTPTPTPSITPTPSVTPTATPTPAEDRFRTYGSLLNYW